MPEGDHWGHEIKLDGDRMHGRLDRGQVKLLTRTGLDWTEKYPTTVKALKALRARQTIGESGNGWGFSASTIHHMLCGWSIRTA